MPMARIVQGAIAVVLVLAAGSFGFHLLYQVSWPVSIYWTLSLISTVSDPRLVPKTPPQILFTAILLVVGTGLWIFWLSTVVAGFLSIDLGYRREKRMMDQLARLSDHYVVLGAGRVGQGIAQELRETGQTVVVVDADPERVKLARESGLLALHVHTFDADAARKVSLGKARGLALALPDDAQNLYAYLTARDINPQMLTVARAQTVESMHHLKQLGVNRVILPDLAGGRRLGRILLKPAAHDLLMALVNEEGVRVHEVDVTAESPMAHHQVRELRTIYGHDHTLIGFWRNQRIHLAPAADEILQPNDCLILVEAGPPEDVVD